MLLLRSPSILLPVLLFHVAVFAAAFVGVDVVVDVFVFVLFVVVAAKALAVPVCGQARSVFVTAGTLLGDITLVAAVPPPLPLV